MLEILCGIETEYGFAVEGSGPENQIQEAREFVEAFPGLCFAGWDYRYESPRRDLRGFTVSHLSIDERDAQFDGPSVTPDTVIRADRVLANGARFYNDHGHPEYATPECWTPWELAHAELEGESLLLQTAHQFGKHVKLYKNNCDFNGSSYGTHENYLVPRKLDPQTIFERVAPILAARMVLCGAGKWEQGRYQLSQRADFLVEEMSVDTLARRPLFNTRDEPHADEQEWQRLHVIYTDANRNPWANTFKVELVRTALQVEGLPAAPQPLVPWAKAVSNGDISAATTMLSTLLNLAQEQLDLDPIRRRLHSLMNDALAAIKCNDLELLRSVCDWAAKQYAIDLFRDEGYEDLRAADLAYADIDPGESFYTALAESNVIRPFDLPRPEPTSRALARGYAIQHHRHQLKTLGWRKIVLNDREIDLEPNRVYSMKEVREIFNDPS